MNDRIESGDVIELEWDSSSPLALASSWCMPDSSALDCSGLLYFRFYSQIGSNNLRNYVVISKSAHLVLMKELELPELAVPFFKLIVPLSLGTIFSKQEPGALRVLACVLLNYPPNT